MNYNYNGYNPIQARMDSLMQQKQMIEQQLNSLQGMSMPAININNNTTPAVPSGLYDGNFKWVDNEEQARNMANNNLPTIYFDNNNPYFYMKNVDGSFKKFKFEEMVELSTNSTDSAMEQRMNTLEGKLNDIIDALTPKTETKSVVSTSTGTPRIEAKPQQQHKGGNQK